MAASGIFRAWGQIPRVTAAGGQSCHAKLFASVLAGLPSTIKRGSCRAPQAGLYETCLPKMAGGRVYLSGGGGISGDGVGVGGISWGKSGPGSGGISGGRSGPGSGGGSGG